MTMSPSQDDGSLNWYHFADELLPGGAGDNPGEYVRPVINLKADVDFTGNGTIYSPYKIVTE